LHGQFVEEAEDILEERIKYAKAHGQTHLHVYVALSSFPLVAFICLRLGKSGAIGEFCHGNLNANVLQYRG
jgi:hypothetical protein